eukprot:NODE_16661_length_984_cov_2.778296.p1 GENE.NODE_16661_length_984_cov_2.778296~~NODE_16661_length_984_cov_2.778296.p1  ORF type:complete len:306 (-),score=129.48 NODE_16661_length_984_cov_2.778296:65-946(-)
MATASSIDAFTKVKEALDKMMATLRQQQKFEYNKHEVCNQKIKEHSDAVTQGEYTKTDLTETHTNLANRVMSLDASAADAKKSIDSYQVILKEAGRKRHLENVNFQRALNDQRATVAILRKAYDRLRAYYGKTDASALAQTQEEVPGMPIGAEPPKPGSYAISKQSGGVLQFFAKIISDADSAAALLPVAEQASQKAYEEVVNDTNAAIIAAQKVVDESTANRWATTSQMFEVKANKDSNDIELARLDKLLKDQHISCDYLIKNFDTRQKARAQEMEAITEAHSILSGSDIGS